MEGVERRAGRGERMNREIHRVVVTGMGAVTPIGSTLAGYWEGLRTGRNGIGRVTQFDPTDLIVQIAGEVKDWDPEVYLERRLARRPGRFAQFAHAAGVQALTASGLAVTETTRDEIGVVMATSGDAFN